MREMFDAYAASSQQRAACLAVTGADGAVLQARDEKIRAGSAAESLDAMQPAVAHWGAKAGDAGWDPQLCRRHGADAVPPLHQIGNSPAVADGAAAVLVGSTAPCSAPT